jgi:hypothetical protein
MSRNAAVSLVVRLFAEPAARGDLVGRAEVVSTGEVVAVRDAEDLARIVTRVNAMEGDQ